MMLLVWIPIGMAIFMGILVMIHAPGTLRERGREALKGAGTAACGTFIALLLLMAFITVGRYVFTGMV
jgi:hypothetical protein